MEEREEDKEDKKNQKLLKSQQRLKSHAKEDFNYLKQTLSGSKDAKRWGGQLPKQRLEPTVLNVDEDEDEDEDEQNDQIMDLAEKADNVLEKEEELISSHMMFIKENAGILTQEGELISYV